MPQTCIQITLDFPEPVHLFEHLANWAMRPEGTHKTNLEHQLLHQTALLCSNLERTIAIQHRPLPTVS